jgi:hypothetical protein
MAKAKGKDEAFLRKLVYIKRELEPILWKLPCIQGIGVGYKYTGGKLTDQPAITVFVTRKVPARYLATSGIVPSKLEIPDPTEDGKKIEIITDVFESGYYSVYSYTTRNRPAQGGDSIGHIDITAGTFGCVVQDMQTFREEQEKEMVILSNNHVLANSNDASEGDPILQPGPYDGGTLDDQIGELKRFVSITFSTTECNYVDAAIASANCKDISFDIHDIGGVEGSYYVGINDLGMKVQKTGRTTGHTTGEIIAIDATVTVNYGSTLKKKLAKFCKQIITTDMSEPGDSGSAGLTESKLVFGLLFAGSDKQTIFNRIDLVERYLKVKVVRGSGPVC